MIAQVAHSPRGCANDGVSVEEGCCTICSHLLRRPAVADDSVQKASQTMRFAAQEKETFYSHHRVCEIRCRSKCEERARVRGVCNE